MIEASFVRVAAIRVREVRSLGERFRPGTTARLIVLGVRGEPAAVGLVRLIEKRSGERQHVVFECPRCHAPALVLFAVRGQLSCKCARRTRHQAEANLAAYRRLGGRDEDRLLRLLDRRGATSTTHALARTLAHRLVTRDFDRLALLLPRIDAALQVTP